MFVYLYFLYFFFFKHMTAYEMRISDWSSDVCSSDLRARGLRPVPGLQAIARPQLGSVSRRAVIDRRGSPDPRPPGPFGLLARTGQTRVPRPDPLHPWQRGPVRPARSEEHTSELQSLMRNSYAVFCLKKKKKQHNNMHSTQYAT